jgi:hypothetical protein
MGLVMNDTVVLFRPEHLNNFDPIEDVSKIEYEKICLQNMVSPGLVLSYIVEDKVIGIFGAKLVYEGVADIWQFNAKDFKKYTLPMSRKLKITLKEVVIPTLNLRRIQGLCDPTKERLRWARFFGMEEEGVLKSFYERGKDVTLVGRAL